MDQPTRAAIGEPGEPFLTYTVTPDDIAATCAFLCSDEARYITGQVIGVNGGPPVLLKNNAAKARKTIRSASANRPTNPFDSCSC